MGIYQGIISSLQAHKVFTGKKYYVMHYSVIQQAERADSLGMAGGLGKVFKSERPRAKMRG